MKRNLFLLALLTGCASLTFAADAASRPNIIFILADDLGWRDLGCYGSTYHKTPNLDSLAQQGMRFTQAYAANPLCSPTRASIMTGLYPARIGITTPSCHLKEVVLEQKVPAEGPPQTKVLTPNSLTRLKQEYFTLAEALKEAGYRTGHFGKWHLGHEPYDPLHQGFDVDFPHWPGPGPAGSYIAPWKFPEELLKGKPGEHIEDRVSAEVVKFVRESKDRPFYANYWLFSVHSPWDGKKELIEKYRALADPKNPQRNPTYAAMVQSLDEGVGRVMKAVKELGLSDRTIFVFFSDNGGVSWWQDTMKTRFGMDCPPTSNLPLRGGKATMHEGGTREPCLVVWPGVTKSGAVSDAIVQSLDFYPTVLEMLGLAPKPGLKLDGVSFVPALKGGASGRDTVFCHFPHTGVDKLGPATYVRKGDWKLIRRFCDHDDQTDGFELYNLKDDLGESNNLAAQMPDKVRELNALIGGFLKDTHAVVPKPNPKYNPKVVAMGNWVDQTKSAKLEGGILKLQVGGTNPFIANASLKHQGLAVFLLRAKSAAGGPGKMTWRTANQKEFAPKNVVTFDLPGDGEWHEVRIALPVQGNLQHVRLFPAAKPGAVEIDWIKLCDKDGGVVREWQFGQ